MGLLITGGRSGGGGKTTAAVIEIFDPEKEGGYKKGKLVYYDGATYIFTAAHTGEWTGDDVESVAIVNSRPVKWMLSLQFDGDITGLLDLLNADSGSVASGDIDQTTGLLEVTIETE